MMTVRCHCTDCINYSEEGGDYIGEGGCVLDEITVSNDTLTAAGFYPQCEDYKERETYE